MQMIVPHLEILGYNHLGRLLSRNVWHHENYSYFIGQWCRQLQKATRIANYVCDTFGVPPPLPGIVGSLTYVPNVRLMWYKNDYVVLIDSIYTKRGFRVRSSTNGTFDYDTDTVLMPVDAHFDYDTAPISIVGQPAHVLREIGNGN